jgi:hypothetical protein
LREDFPSSLARDAFAALNLGHAFIQLLIQVPTILLNEVEGVGDDVGRRMMVAGVASRAGCAVRVEGRR